jgi:hypothetical protein
MLGLAVKCYGELVILNLCFRVTRLGIAMLAHCVPNRNGMAELKNPRCVI